MILKINRETRTAYSARKIKVFVNGNFAGELNNGHTLEIPLPPTQNNIINLKIGNKTMAVATIDTENCNDDVVQIVCWASGKGGIEFYSNSALVQKQMDASSKSATGWIIFAVVATIALLFYVFRPRLILFFPL